MFKKIYPDLRFYKKIGELTIPKSLINKDLVVTELGSIINPNIIFTEVQKPFELISNNVILSASQVKDLKELFLDSNLTILVNKMYTYKEKGTKVLLEFFERC